MTRALLVYPEFRSASFWNYRETCELVDARYPAAPLGLCTVAALLPPEWEVSLIDRNILRFALAEVLYFPDVPSGVIIDEAIEIAHRYSSEEAGRLVNGLVDRAVKEFRGGTA